MFDGKVLMAEWWYNNKTGAVEEGQQSLGSDRDGPYSSKEEAARAVEIARERSRQWAAEDAGEK
ncbi:hypothetical protein BH11ACT2_BH11ACT2_19080 [soil metagenome]